MIDPEVPSPKREGWEARNAHRVGREAGDLGVYTALKYLPGTPEREEWEAGWKDLDDAIHVRLANPHLPLSLLMISFPPRKRYKLSLIHI